MRITFRPRLKAVLLAMTIVCGQTNVIAQNGAPPRFGSASATSPIVIAHYADIPLEFGNSLRVLRRTANWDGLEKQARLYRQSKAAWPNGYWKLDTFYDQVGLGMTGQERVGKDKEALIAIEHLRNWVKAKPESVTARVALANELFRFAWQARGHGFANTVSREALRKFAEREKESLQILAEANGLKENCPHIGMLLLEIGRDQNLSEARFNRIFEECVHEYPDYWSAYLEKTISLLPRWGGNPGDCQAFAADSARKSGANGDKLYARLIWRFLGQELPCGSSFTSFKIDWPCAKRGFNALVAEYPESVPLLNEFCYLACLAGDYRQAKTMFEKMQGRCDTTVWSVADFLDYKLKVFNLKMPVIDPGKPPALPPSMGPQQLCSIAYGMQMNGMTKEANAYLERALKQSPNLPEAIFTRGVIRAYNNQAQEARADFDHVISVKPSFSAYLERGKLEFREKNFQQAIAYLSKAIDLADNDAVGWATRGQCYMVMNEQKKAVSDFSSALKFDPRNRIALDGLAELTYAKTPCTDSEQWALACAGLLAKANDWQLDTLMGKAPTAQNKAAAQAGLAKWWTVHNREQLLERLYWLENGGHRAEFDMFIALAKNPSRAERLRQTADVSVRSDLDKKFEIAKANEAALEGKSILGWDLSRYIFLCRDGVLLGYLSPDEAWAKIMPKARTLQQKFSSWKELGDNYLIGRKFWQPGANHKEFEANLEWLLSNPNSPWVKLPWKTDLSRSDSQWSAATPQAPRTTASSVERPAQSINTNSPMELPEVPESWLTGYEDPAAVARGMAISNVRIKALDTYVSSRPDTMMKSVDKYNYTAGPFEVGQVNESASTSKPSVNIRTQRALMCACFLEGQELKSKDRAAARRHFIAAVQTFSMVRPFVRDELGETSAEMASLWRNLGRCYDELNEYAMSAEAYRRANVIYSAVGNGQDSFEQEICRWYLGNALLHLDKYDEAEKNLTASLPLLTKQLGEKSTYVATCYKNLASICDRNNRQQDAAAWQAKYKRSLAD